MFISKFFKRNKEDKGSDNRRTIDLDDTGNRIERIDPRYEADLNRIEALKIMIETFEFAINNYDKRPKELLNVSKQHIQNIMINSINEKAEIERRLDNKRENKM
jgi:hypothetical protein